LPRPVAKWLSVTLGDGIWSDGATLSNSHFLVGLQTAVGRMIRVRRAVTCYDMTGTMFSAFVTVV